MFSDHGWPWVTNTAESETVGGGGATYRMCVYIYIHGFTQLCSLRPEFWPHQPWVKRSFLPFPGELCVSRAEGLFPGVRAPLTRVIILSAISQSASYKPLTSVPCFHSPTGSPTSKLTVPPLASTKWHHIGNLNLSVSSLFRGSFHSWLGREAVPI